MPFLALRAHDFYPLTLTMPVENMLFGMFSLRERWNKISEKEPDLLKRWVEPTVLPDLSLISAIKALSVNQVLKQDKLLLAAHLDDQLHGEMIEKRSSDFLDKVDVVTYDRPFEWIDSLQYMIAHNKDQIIKDWETSDKNINWTKPHRYNNTHISPDVHLPDVSIDDRQGPVIIHQGVTILPGAKIMGPIVLLPESLVKMGAELYPGSTIGHHVVVNGEVKNAIIHEYTAKGHAGFLGDSILGRWNNFGSGTTVSNVANTFSDVRIKDWNTGLPENYDTLKRGLITGDFVKLGILSKTYRGTAIGSFCSIATGNAITGNIPPFTWWTEKDKIRYEADPLRKHCERQMALRQLTWNDEWEVALSRLLNHDQMDSNSGTL